MYNRYKYLATYKQVYHTSLQLAILIMLGKTYTSYKSGHIFRYCLKQLEYSSDHMHGSFKQCSTYSYAFVTGIAYIDNRGNTICSDCSIREY